jgi:acetoin utilization deacetylase AcuC-like enzyme
MFDRLRNSVRRWIGGERLVIWYDPAYRLPLASVEGQTGMDPRRADLVATYLIDRGVITSQDLRTPSRIRYHDLARVHDEKLLESLHDPKTLADVFAVDPSDIIVDEVLHAVRLACGGTLDAARTALARSGPTLNLLGGFHHAGPTRAGGFCVLNDIAVAIQVLRAEGFRKRVVILDLDAHPPDGSAECFPDDPSVWIGSLSGSDWGALPTVDETRLPPGCDDGSYLAALEALLGRLPSAGLAFVIAGGDVLGGDRFGALAMTLDGARRRDHAVSTVLGDLPSVWLPGGGYTQDAWKVLAGTALVLALDSLEPIARDVDPLGLEFSRIARELGRGSLEGEDGLTAEDLMESLGQRSQPNRFLDFYTVEGLEYALYRYGILQHLRRLGYGSFRIAIDRDGRGDRMRLFAQADGQEHLLYEVVLEKQKLGPDEVLYVHWLTLRHPRGRFSAQRPRLPGQEEPGLGLSREAGQLLVQSARRLGLAGIAFRPSWFHTAYPARPYMRFVDPARQGRFEALLRDLRNVPLLQATAALSEGRVCMNTEPYVWEADEMVHWLTPHDSDRAAVAAERDRVRFELVPAAQIS